MTQSTVGEIESLFELANPVARHPPAPPKGKRTPPVGLGRQIMRLLVAHPSLAADLDQNAMEAFTQCAPDHAEMLGQLVAAGRAMGEHATFAVLAEHLREAGPDFEPMIAEIAAESESDADTARVALSDAIRKMRMQALTEELNRLIGGGLSDDAAKMRYRDLTLQQEQLRRQTLAEAGQR
jgi:DNA primase